MSALTITEARDRWEADADWLGRNGALNAHKHIDYHLRLNRQAARLSIPCGQNLYGSVCDALNATQPTTRAA